MKLVTLLVPALLISTLQAQETVVVTTGPGNATQTWYSLQNGVQESRPLSEWDLAFEIPGFTASIRVNTAKGMMAYKAPYSIDQWATLDTMGMHAGWTMLNNSDTSWSHGALNQGLTENEFDLGWGVYNIVTHQVTGDSVFVVKLANEEWKKLKIDGLVGNVYSFTWASLDGSNEQMGTLNKAGHAGKNFGYYSLETAQTLDREPASADWDLLFTRYVRLSPDVYPVTGILLNSGRPALRVDGPPETADWQSGPYSTHINTIGYDWKTFNMQTFQYEYNEELAFFVTDAEGNIWKLVFIEFGGGTTGDITFTQELVSATSVEEIAAGADAFTLFPNPAQQGAVNLLVKAAVNNAVVSLHDMSGRLVAQQPLTGLSGPQVRTLNTGMLTPGMYVVRLESAGISASQRLVIE